MKYLVGHPGFSRASSSNSVTPPVQPPPTTAMNRATSLRSRHNLHGTMRITSTLPPSGQQSSPKTYTNTVITCAYRHQDPIIPAMKQQPSPPQPIDERNNNNTLYTKQKNLRGSKNSLNRPTNDMVQHQTLSRDRPISAYIE
ncbi:hypothetical protein HCN44_011045 [Aphidius gifuensis]|uniref:Uncharacterized protein n=1 Tax=Aphidius gifuensis TaxID=684658 RepID=A0A834XX90_APHGI|nr:hypothetical protein HCN44_011045 [Aphidius gifuensis]